MTVQGDGFPSRSGDVPSEFPQDGSTGRSELEVVRGPPADGYAGGRGRPPPISAEIRHYTVICPTKTWGFLPRRDEFPRYLPGGRDGWCLRGFRWGRGLLDVREAWRPNFSP